MFARARSFLRTTTFKQTSLRPLLLPNLMAGKRPLCSMPNVRVEHDSKRQEFHIEFPDGRAFLKYEKEGNLFMIMHTEVPKHLGGRGLGGILAKAALVHIEENKYRLAIYCDFVQHYIEKQEPKYLKYLK